MDAIEWSEKKKRSSRRRSVSSLEGSSRSVEKEVLVYHRRSVQEREEAAERRREREAVQGLEQIGDAVVYSSVMALPTSGPVPRATRFEREGGVIELRPYILPPELEEKVTAGVLLCRIKKGLLGIKKRVKETINGKPYKG